MNEAENHSVLKAWFIPANDHRTKLMNLTNTKYGINHSALKGRSISAKGHRPSLMKMHTYEALKGRDHIPHLQCLDMT